MRLKLESGSWYAMELFLEQGDPDSRHYSPIKVESIYPRRTGTRSFELAFYHANYTEGVRSKTYELRTIERAGSFIFAERLDAGMRQFLMILPVSAGWLNKHFDANISEGELPDSWLEMNT